MIARRPSPPSQLCWVAGVAFALTCLVGCSAVTSNTAQLVTPAAARAAVVHHWDLNRRALRANSASEARRLIEEVEGGDALRMDEDVIVREAEARAATHSTPPPIPDAGAIRVFVPRQSGYPAVFISVRKQLASNPDGAATDKTTEVLELFRRASPGATWRNVGYAEIAPGLSARLDLAIDRDGYAAFAQGEPGGSQLSNLYTTYMTAALIGHPEQASPRIAAGPLTDQFATQIQRGLAAVPSVRRLASFANSQHQEGIKLRMADGGTFVLFNNTYQVVTTPVAGGCISAGPGSTVPGSYKSVTDHFLQDLAAIVGAGSQGPVSLIAESDSVVSVDTKACAGDATI